MRRTVFLFILILSVTLVQTTFAERWTPLKPDHATIYESDNHRLLNVKFVQGTDVRMRNDKLTSLSGYDIQPFYNALASYDVDQVALLFSRPEHKLDEFRRSGELNSGKELADLNNWYRIVLSKDIDRKSAEDVLNRILQLSIVETVYAVPEITVAEDIDPETPDLTDEQGYLYEDPEGINAEAAWDIEGGTGDGIKIIDIEFAWNLDHEDFPEEHFYFGGDTVDNSSDHGDAVIGIMIGQHNEYGINGICPDAQIGVECAFGMADIEEFADHIDAVAAELDPGDIFLIELQGNFGGVWAPMETWQANFDAIETAVANDIFCLEAAGNGNQNLDSDNFGDRFDPENRHSGAIMIGAGAPPSGNFGPDRSRLDFSNYGQRLDLQGWGREVATTGNNGDLFFPNNDVRQRYTSSFAGTSSATPIVAGAVACFQGIYKAMMDDGTIIQPARLRDYFVATGSPQSEEGRQGHIGPRPNITAALQLLRDPGTVFGQVVRAENGEPIQDVTVTVDFDLGTFADEELTTDVDGNWRIEGAPSDLEFSVYASKFGFNDTSAVELSVGENDTVEVVLAMLHPEFAVSDEEIPMELEPNEAGNFAFSVINEGNGPLTWTAEITREENEGARPWNLDNIVHIDGGIGAGVLGGVAIVGDRMFVPGGYWNRGNLIYIMDLEGALLDSFPQPNMGRYGMVDLAWDGALLWGGDDREVFGFLPENRQDRVQVQFRTPIRPIQAMAWDPDTELLWMSGQQTNILGYTRDGELTAELVNPGFVILGMVYIEAAQDYPLHILHAVNEFDFTIHKMNPETGDTVYVATLIPEEGGIPGGAFVSNEFDPRGNLTFFTVYNNVDNEGGNRIDMYKRLLSGDAWLTWEAAEEGLLVAGEEEEFLILFNSSELGGGVYEGSLYFTHNAIGGDVTIPIMLTVTDPFSVNEPEIAVPTDFAIASVYPNPFNSTATIRFTLPTADDVTFELVDLSGRVVSVVGSQSYTAGEHNVSVRGIDLPSGVYFIQMKGTVSTRVSKVALVK